MVLRYNAQFPLLLVLETMRIVGVVLLSKRLFRRFCLPLPF